MFKMTICALLCILTSCVSKNKQVDIKSETVSRSIASEAAAENPIYITYTYDLKLNLQRREWKPFWGEYVYDPILTYDRIIKTPKISKKWLEVTNQLRSEAQSLAKPLTIKILVNSFRFPDLKKCELIYEDQNYECEPVNFTAKIDSYTKKIAVKSEIVFTVPKVLIDKKHSFLNLVLNSIVVNRNKYKMNLELSINEALNNQLPFENIRLDTSFSLFSNRIIYDKNKNFNKEKYKDFVTSALFENPENPKDIFFSYKDIIGTEAFISDDIQNLLKNLNTQYRIIY